MNGLLGAQLGAQSGMTSNGVMGYADLIRKKLMETLAPKTAEEIKSETPQPTAPKDYTAGLTPPEIGGVPSKLEFKATPNRLSAFMVALGQIMQNKYNTERAKEEQAQGLYESRLKSGQALNQFQTELGMKEAAEARDPYRQAQIEKAKNDIAMSPIEMKIKEASLANLLKRGERIGKTGSGKATPQYAGATPELTIEDVRANIKKAPNKKEVDFWKSKLAAFEKTGTVKMSWGSGIDPNDGFDYEYQHNVNGEIIPTGIKRRKNIDPFAAQMSREMGIEPTTPGGAAPINPQPKPKATIKKPKTKEEYQALRQTMTKEQIEALPE